MRTTCRLQIDAPAEKVFDFLRDPKKHPLWLRGVEETQFDPNVDPNNPLGARFKQRIRQGKQVNEYDGEVTAYAPPKHLAIRLFAPQFEVAVDYRLTPEGGGTQLDYTADVICRSWLFRLVGRLFGFLMRGVVRKQLEKLKQLAEA
jgi:uncharacterized protein YndB with AHSA1/START domain